MRSIAKLNLSTKLLLTGFVLAVSMPCVFANTLSEIQINAGAAGSNGAYEVVLKTDESAQMKKVVSTNDKMYIELKNVQASENLNTIYNNVANIDNVTVQPSSKEDIKIILKGKDIAQSKVLFETIKTSLPSAPQAQSIELSKPMTSYTPVYNPEAFASTEGSQTSNPELNETLTKMHVTREMLVSAKTIGKKLIKKAKSLDSNMLIILGVLLVAGALIFRPKKQAPAQRPTNTGIGLSAAAMDREVGLNRGMASKMELNRPNAVGTGYGMKAYQQSQRNPYMTGNTPSNGVSGIARRKPSPARGAAPAQPVKRQTVAQKPINTSAMMNSPIKPQAPALQKQGQTTDLDSVKFLESITKIYENNGRTDLAKGLKDNLRKAQTRQPV